MTVRLGMSPAAVSARLRCVSDLSTDLAPDRRLDSKLDMSPTAISARLKECAALLELCQRLQQARPTQ
jgi:hypothetical protein